MHPSGHDPNRKGCFAAAKRGNALTRFVMA
jgi:hypothetical protein